MRAAIAGALAVCVAFAALACSSRGHTLDTAPGAAPDSSMPGDIHDIDPRGVYRAAGLLVHGSPLGFVGSVSFLGSDSPDSTLVLVSIALANRALEFRPEGTLQRASYTVAIDFHAKGSDSTVASVLSHESVRVASARETSASGPNIVFEKLVPVPPGEYTMLLSVQDDRSPEAGSMRDTLTVPRIGAGSLSSIVPVFSAAPRASADSSPSFIANPSATAVFGRDSVVKLYLEGYALSDSARLSIALLDDANERVLEDSVMLKSSDSLSAVVRELPIARVGPGRFTVVASLAGSSDSVRAPLFVSFGPGIGILTFDEMLTRLRYFATPEQLRALGATPRAERATAWAQFWKETDPVSSTPEHEGLRDYFDRIASANRRFAGEGMDGWLTDRGKVYVALGAPDRIQVDDDRGSGVRASSQSWDYIDYDVQLVFVSDMGFDRWRLTPASELDFERALQRARLH
ncbi:MAG TPA: GWxTD domain-containing protein [Gemmatimonadaceae bacterium]|nr:GWxTD domain-containing protein [Gemmatimonadaceae bacterium]